MKNNIVKNKVKPVKARKRQGNAFNGQGKVNIPGVYAFPPAQAQEVARSFMYYLLSETRTDKTDTIHITDDVEINCEYAYIGRSRKHIKVEFRILARKDGVPAHVAHVIVEIG